MFVVLFELQGYINAHLGKKLPYRFDFVAGSKICSEAADQIPDRVACVATSSTGITGGGGVGVALESQVRES